MKKTAVITGATSGLGWSYARHFAAKGLDLIITGRREPLIRQNAEALRRMYGVSVQAVIVDLADADGVDRLINCMSGREIAVLVNNAGFGLKTAFAETDMVDVGRMLGLQVDCVTRLTHHVLRGMLEREEGCIINIASDGAFAVMPRNVLYSSTKLYIVNLTEGLHMELVGTGVRVQAVCPGFVDSHFHESAGMRVNKQQRGIFAFRQPDDVVAEAMRDLERGKVVSVPDRGARIIRALVRWMPRRMFYRQAIGMSARMAGGRAKRSTSDRR